MIYQKTTGRSVCGAVLSKQAFGGLSVYVATRDAKHDWIMPSCRSSDKELRNSGKVLNRII